ncbi:MAG: HEAT repeat domain-containing protein [Flammeovirgaceae bacterium]
MNKEEFESKLLDYMQGNLNPEEKQGMEAYMAQQGQDLSEFHELNTVWLKMEDLATPAPSTNMRDKFYQNLASFKQDEAQKKKTSLQLLLTFLTQLFQQAWAKQLAFGLLFALVGWVIGYQMRGNETLSNLESMATEMQHMKQVMMLSLMEQESASKRIKAVNMVHNMDNVDERVIKLLLKSLNEDPNINVRLVAAEALQNFTSRPLVRQNLIQSITTQESPLVQIALVDVLLSLQDNATSDALKALLENEKINLEVRKKAAQALGTSL